MILWAILLVVCNLFWLVLTAMTLPGNWLMVGTTVAVAWWQWDKGMFSPWTLIAITLLAIVGEVLEGITSAVGVRKAGGSRLGGFGALVGSLVGLTAGTFLIPIPILGSIAGACVGAFGGAMLLEKGGGKTNRQALKSGTAAGVGRFLGTVFKLLAGIVIWIIVAVAAFWP
ncbi:MAG: DUF456 family protein [Phycisphaerae bacterium]|nr:DUF456 family protein [Phycisphaerae bacterium]